MAMAGRDKKGEERGNYACEDLQWAKALRLSCWQGNLFARGPRERASELKRERLRCCNQSRAASARTEAVRVVVKKGCGGLEEI